MSPEEVALSLLRIALAVAPSLADLIRGGPADHPLRKRVDEIIGEVTESHAAAAEIRRLSGR